jgi:hypothetical protein
MDVLFVEDTKWPPLFAGRSWSSKMSIPPGVAWCGAQPRVYHCSLHHDTQGVSICLNPTNLITVMFAEPYRSKLRRYKMLMSWPA